MVQPIVSKRAGIVVVDPSESVRMEIAATLRNAGYPTITTFANTADAKRHIRGAETHWIILSLMAHEKDNALTLLKFMMSEEKFRKVRVSLLLDDSEASCLPLAFELGLLSWHPKIFTRASLASELSKLEQISVACSNDCTLIAARYLKAHLQKFNSHKSALSLAQTLVELYYGRPEMLLELAEAQFSAGRPEDGRGTLIQAKLFDRSLESKAFDIIKRHGCDFFKDDITNARLCDIGISTCVLIDPDSSVASQVGQLMKANKVEKFESFTDSSQAWDWLSANPEPDLLIQEWRLPGLSGAALLQRVRNKGYVDVPIVLLSSLLTPSDGPLLSEMSVSNVVQKPFTNDALLTGLRWTVVQENLPTDYKSLQKKILRHLKRGEITEARQAKVKLFSLKEISEGTKKYIEAEFHYFEKDFEKAKSMAIESIKLMGKDSLHGLNVLGRSLLNLKEYAAAERVLEQAQKLSPQNFGRLMDIAEMKIAKNQGTEALALVDQAKQIDGSNKKVTSAEIRAAISANDTDRAGKLMLNADSLSTLVSYMNNRAVALSRTGRYKEAVGLYKSTFDSLPQSEKKTKAQVLYNLSLCHCRNNQLQDAKTVLDALAKETGGDTLKKAHALLRKVDQAIKTGTAIDLDGGADNAKMEDVLDDLEECLFEPIGNEAKATMAAPAKPPVEMAPGETCLVGIFTPQEKLSDFALALQAKLV